MKHVSHSFNIIALTSFCDGLLTTYILGASKLQIKGIGTINNACPGSTLILECTVNGREGDTVTTVWEGTAFNGCNIILLHSRFGEAEGNSSKECNNGAITVQRTLRMEKNGSFDIIYVSQLKVAVTSKMIGESIDCSHDNGTTSILVGSLKLNGSTSCAYTTLNTSIVHLVTLENEGMTHAYIKLIV